MFEELKILYLLIMLKLLMIVYLFLVNKILKKLVV